MNIAIDHDLTYDQDPKLWDLFIATALQRGHKVWGVTKREPHLTVYMSCPVIYTSRKAKRPFVKAKGIHIDVWIDDSPEGILFNDGAQVQVQG